MTKKLLEKFTWDYHRTIQKEKLDGKSERIMSGKYFFPSGSFQPLCILGYGFSYHTSINT